MGHHTVTVGEIALGALSKATAAACSRKDPPVHYGYFQLFRQAALISAPPFLPAICVADGKAICAAFFKRAPITPPLFKASNGHICRRELPSRGDQHVPILSPRPNSLPPEASHTGARTSCVIQTEATTTATKREKRKISRPGLFCVCPRVQ